MEIEQEVKEPEVTGNVKRILKKLQMVDLEIISDLRGISYDPLKAPAELDIPKAEEKGHNILEFLKTQTNTTEIEVYKKSSSKTKNPFKCPRDDQRLLLDNKERKVITEEKRKKCPLHKHVSKHDREGLIKQFRAIPPKKLSRKDIKRLKKVHKLTHPVGEEPSKELSPRRLKKYVRKPRVDTLTPPFLF
ncbi:unnamed protein product [Moneuplotes crassus]|uniref:Uncharacterized protein n=1 Tax=Euplotes crassus TaxID=5936 RepID=A0AAD2D6U2_EUPCR|nr:unnamed protein product [Moneuplotes crassus]